MSKEYHAKYQRDKRARTRLAKTEIPRKLSKEEKDELWQKIENDETYKIAFLQEKSKANFFWFCKKILGYEDLNAEHEALCEFLQYDPAKTKLMLMPRYTFKSSIITIGHSLWRLVCNPNEKIIFYSDANEKAEGFLAGVKHHILGNIDKSLFRAVFGRWEVDPKRGVWNQSAIVIKPRTTAAVEPSIETAGIETSKVGRHYTRMKFDDIVSDKNVTTKELMDKTESVFNNAGSLLEPSGHTDIAGTRWHFGDLYGRIIADRRGDKDFAFFHRKAYDGDKYFFTDIGPNSLTKDFLEAKKKAQGSYTFSCLYQNEPVDDENATFKAADFAFYDWTQLPTGLYVTCCLDPIPPHDDGAKGDDAAITVCGTDDELNIYVLEIIAGRLQPSEQIEEIFRLHQKWGINTLGVETNAFQKTMRRDIDFRYAEERKKNPRFRFFHIEEFVGASLPNKISRIRGLQPYHERGALRFPGKSLDTLRGVWYDAALQMLQFPKSAKDDITDSLAGHINIHRAGSKTEIPKEIPYTSAAWYERELRKKEVKEMGRRPRWQRKPLAPLTFS